MSKVVSAEFAASLIKDGMTVGVGGFVGFGSPEELLIALQERYKQTKSPKDITIFHCAGLGDGAEKGANHLAEEGLSKRIICAHLGLEPKISKLLVENKMIGFCVPQGVTSQMLRATAGKKPGVLTHVGLNTFADPRVEGCKVNQATRDSGEEIVSLINIEGKNYLLYKSVPIDICFIKGSFCDEDGNTSLEKEALISDQLEMAAATHNSGGIVILQVDNIVKKGTIKAHDVKIHGFLVDYIVKGSPENSVQTFAYDYYRPELSGEITIPLDSVEPMELGNRKVCGRRGAIELKKGSLVNLGIGVPEAVAAVAGEEGISGDITLSIESGVLGGVPTGGLGIGGTVNPEAIIKQPDIFDIYDGGGLDVSFLGAAEIDEKGNVNVSKFGGRVIGPGGFINISQNAKKVCFTGTFTAGKLVTKIEDGKLTIIEEGKGIKFKKSVEQITFSADYANESGQEILYITERAVFKLTDKGITLVEIAPGVDLEKDILANMEFKPIIAENLKLMDERIFKDEKMGLSF
ncbi:acetate CoA-transferase YdiF [Clostridium homopropionicum DSM 5847]|uniref:Acetate CoA-transferase YdiF n=1 Tax=Clostridium homopropionicum DSM 5847 TaxID=1121318 RepID=A0A0L6Z5N0_9CLOT|nr:CoA-transferase [Clostridium homopropionicum]KOA18261.1 acetate CoA-transferase YdiF [Clostridium homopropionicum DSM 5847]SFF70265.1 propionate CoA-transferase [Clostridium homopropionicum]